MSQQFSGDVRICYTALTYVRADTLSPSTRAAAFREPVSKKFEPNYNAVYSQLLPIITTYAPHANQPGQVELEGLVDTPKKKKASFNEPEAIAPLK